MEVCENRNAARGRVTRRLAEMDTPRLHRGVIAGEVVGMQEQQHPPAGLVADADFLVRCHRLAETRRRPSEPGGDMVTQRLPPVVGQTEFPLLQFLLTLASLTQPDAFDPKRTPSHPGSEAPLVPLEVSVFTDWERAIKVHGNLGRRHAAAI
jgi:hypothetical protein